MHATEDEFSSDHTVGLPSEFSIDYLTNISEPVGSHEYPNIIQNYQFISSSIVDV